MKNIKTYEEFNEEINWKKAAIGTALAGSLLGGMSSCKKKPLPGDSSVTVTSKTELPQNQNCNCGTIFDDKILIINHESVYTLTVKNRCSGNEQTFYVDRDTWMRSYVGNDICFTNVPNWKEVKNPEKYQEIKHINKQIVE